MRGEYFLKAINDVNSKYIEEAREKTMKKRFNFKPIIAVAACAVFALAAIPVANHFANNNMVDGGTTAGTVATTDSIDTQETVQTQITQTPISDKLGASGGYVAYDMGTHSGENNLKAEQNIEMLINKGGTQIIEKNKVATKKTIEFGGKKWTGTYEYTRISDYYGDDEYFYYGEDDSGKGCSFSVNPKTGMCTYFYATRDNDMSKEAKYTQDECFEIAVKYLSNYIEDAEAYELKYAYERDWENGYYFMMYRSIDGIATSDRVSIGVRKTGEVYTHVFHSLGEMKDVDVSAIDMASVEKVISEKINVIYKDNYTFTHEISHLELVKLADGSYVFDCTVDVEGKNSPESLTARDTRFIAVIVK